MPRQCSARAGRGRWRAPAVALGPAPGPGRGCGWLTHLDAWVPIGLCLERRQPPGERRPPLVPAHPQPFVVGERGAHALGEWDEHHVDHARLLAQEVRASARLELRTHAIQRLAESAAAVLPRPEPAKPRGEERALEAHQLARLGRCGRALRRKHRPLGEELLERVHLRSAAEAEAQAMCAGHGGRQRREQNTPSARTAALHPRCRCCAPLLHGARARRSSPSLRALRRALPLPAPPPPPCRTRALTMSFDSGTTLPSMIATGMPPEGEMRRKAGGLSP